MHYIRGTYLHDLMFSKRKYLGFLIGINRCHSHHSSTKKIPHVSQNLVRVRFAPSPTGKMHFGGLRTALFNHIFAKQNNGSFILRIEDTDKARLVEGSAEHIEDILTWFSIPPDESPLKGGPYEPYVQSKRLPSYKAIAERLVGEGLAYRCFCSEMRLELLRKQQAKNRQRIRYDGRCKSLTQSEIEDKLKENDGRYVIRFALQPGSLTFEDGVYGKNTQDLLKSGEGDFVILKRDGYPTYHLANVVDDNAMNITHVLRGGEWLASTTKHIQIYNALGWQVPSYYHFPLLTNHDGTKLSKRQNDMDLDNWRSRSFDSLAILNYLTALGGGMPKSKQDTVDVWNLSRLIDEFDFSRILTNSSRFSVERLIQFNACALKNSWKNDPEAFVNCCLDFLKSRNIAVDLEAVSMRHLIGLIVDRLSSLEDLLSNEFGFLWQYPELDFSDAKYELDYVTCLNETIRTIEQLESLEKDPLMSNLKLCAAKNDISWSDYMRFLRKSLTNCKVGLPVVEILMLLGRSRSVEYLKSALQQVQHFDANKQ